METRNLYNLLGLFGIMSGDVNFILDELEAFEVDFDDLADEFESYQEYIKPEQITNTLICNIYVVAYRKAIFDISTDEELELEEYFDIYTNSINSHLYINLPSGQREAYNKEDLIELTKELIKELN